MYGDKRDSKIKCKCMKKLTNYQKNLGNRHETRSEQDKNT